MRSSFCGAGILRVYFEADIMHGIVFKPRPNHQGQSYLNVLQLFKNPLKAPTHG